MNLALFTFLLASVWLAFTLGFIGLISGHGRLWFRIRHCGHWRIVLILSVVFVVMALCVGLLMRGEGRL